LLKSGKNAGKNGVDVSMMVLVLKHLRDQLKL